MLQSHVKSQNNALLLFFFKYYTFENEVLIYQMKKIQFSFPQNERPESQSQHISDLIDRIYSSRMNKTQW